MSFARSLWFRHAKPATPYRHPRRVRPTLEALEDRTAPSATITVNS